MHRHHVVEGASNPVAGKQPTLRRDGQAMRKTNAIRTTTVNSCGESLVASRPWGANLSLSAGLSMTSRIAALSFATISGGVFAGANSPHQVLMS